MAEQEKDTNLTEETPEVVEEPAVEEAPAPEAETAPDPAEELKTQLAAKEKTEAYSKAKADAALAFLPVYDNLERALKQGSEDEAFLKGVEMTMTQLVNVLDSLGIKAIEAEGKPFDPNFHNAVMHIKDETLGENVVAQVFQTGFIMGDKVIRFAMVQVAN